MKSKVLVNPVEKIATRIYDNREGGSAFVAQNIASVIRKNNEANKHTVLGLATGNSPLLVYKELIKYHLEEGLSFKNVFTFNLDEYYPMGKKDDHSYNYFIYEKFLSKIDVRPENVHIPDGELPLNEVVDYCKDYDAKIESLGGLDVQILGIGRSGHIGFNEPGSKITDGTRLLKLDNVTISDASEAFGGISNVPTQAITMGVKTILQAKKIFLVAWGKEKADVIQKAIEEVVSSEVSASFLQKHNDTLFVLDPAAASKLTRFVKPVL